MDITENKKTKGTIYFANRDRSDIEHVEKRSKEEKRKDRERERSHNYSGVFYRLGFKTDRSISVTGLQFLGPFENRDSPFAVVMGIQQEEEDWSNLPEIFRCMWPYGPLYKILELQPPIRKYVGKVEKEMKFTVNFPIPVKVEANKLTDILFEIQGPKTARMSRIASREKILLDDFSPLTMEFVGDSGQLSGIYFTMD